jgi:hypothetical protein
MAGTNVSRVDTPRPSTGTPVASYMFNTIGG